MNSQYLRLSLSGHWGVQGWLRWKLPSSHIARARSCTRQNSTDYIPFRQSGVLCRYCWLHSRLLTILLISNNTLSLKCLENILDSPCRPSSRLNPYTPSGIPLPQNSTLTCSCLPVLSFPNGIGVPSSPSHPRPFPTLPVAIFKKVGAKSVCALTKSFSSPPFCIPGPLMISGMLISSSKPHSLPGGRRCCEMW